MYLNAAYFHSGLHSGLDIVKVTEVQPFPEMFARDHSFIYCAPTIGKERKNSGVFIVKSFLFINVSVPLKIAFEKVLPLSRYCSLKIYINLIFD